VGEGRALENEQGNAWDQDAEEIDYAKKDVGRLSAHKDLGRFGLTRIKLQLQSISASIEAGCRKRLQDVNRDCGAKSAPNIKHQTLSK
jgi:hypothetical protein